MFKKDIAEFRWGKLLQIKPAQNGGRTLIKVTQFKYNSA